MFLPSLQTKPILFVLISTLLVAVLAFGLGRLSKIEQGIVPVQIITPTVSTSSTVVKPTPAKPGLYVASKNGTRYYLNTCSGASRIKEENKVYFSNRTDAERAGLTPAANCPGL